jgi:uncharacterized protein
MELRPPRERVSPRARYLWTCTDLLRCVPPMALLLLATGPWNWFELPRWCLIGIAVLFLAYGVLVPQWRYLVHRWEVTETAVYTQTGWWALERRIAPMSRIQTVDHAEGAVSRLFGLSTVTVTTASAAGALEIAGLDRLRARALVDELTIKADSVPGDAT